MSTQTQFYTVSELSNFLDGFYEGVPDSSMSGKICTNVGRDENIKFSKDKISFVATQFQSLDIVGCIPQMPICISNVRIGESEGKGNGIFAKHSIPEGTIITLFPVDMCEVYDSNSRYLYYSEIMMNFTQESEDTGHAIFQESVLEYCFDLDNNRKVVALKTNTSNDAFLAHIANDGSTDFSTRKGYLTSSLKSHNCIIKRLPGDNSFILALVATRDIVEDEEIFRMYSLDFWFKTPPNLQYVEFEDEKCNSVIKSFEPVAGLELIKEFKRFKGFKRICIYKDGNSIICTAFLVNIQGNADDEFKYASIHHHDDTQSYRFQISFMNKLDDVPDFIFSDFISNVGRRYPCMIFSKVEIPLIDQSGFRLI